VLPIIRYLKFLNRLRRGHQPVFLEYKVDFRPRWTDGEGNPHLARIISARRRQYVENLGHLAGLLPVVQSIERGEGSVEGIDWKNHFIPAVDALSLMWAATRAKTTFMEVGSGNSTLFAKAALEHFKSSVKIISIDPQPRVGIDRFCDEVIRRPLEDVDLSLFDRLQPGDTLFVDNSHRSFMNSDVTAFMLDVLPRLKPGVLVGIHDVFLPFDYFSHWSNRAYNEQYLLGCYLVANPQYFEIQLANYWIWKNGLHIDALQDIWAVLGADIRDRPSSAFWAIKNAPVNHEAAH
jgi:hypothetical protein